MRATSPQGRFAEGAARLDGQTLIIHENRPKAWAKWARAVGVPTPKAGKILRFDSMSTLVEAAARGLGFAIVSWPLSKTWFESGQLVRVYDTEWVTDECFHLRTGRESRNAWTSGEP